ncbi:hypothetical protein F5Y14DRAFT_122289 [Nemania sp. NC0429]|nr:hypothetical protein F5Y14DRAFT_122289 [Nemania sp. NC0429]
MSNLPTDFSACESSDFSYLFYVKNGTSIAYLKSSSTTENNKTIYSTNNVTVGSNLVTTASPRISAVAYSARNGDKEIRLYYVEKLPNVETYQLKELCRTDKRVGGEFRQGDWFPGSLNDNNVYCKKDSLISANVEEGKGDLKVFFVDINGSPGIAWVMMETETWTWKTVKNVAW